MTANPAHLSPEAKANLPEHVAIIMDGNGRWAKQRHLPRIEGHRHGVEAVRSVVRAAGELGIKYLTLYAFSVENWKRPRTEVETLWRLLRYYLRKEVAHLMQNNIRLRAIGNLRTVIRESPHDHTPLVQLARCHLAWIQATRPSPTSDQLAESRQIVEAALTRSEFRLWTAYLTQAALLKAEGKPEDAVRRLNQALDLAPTEFKAVCTGQLDAIKQDKTKLSPEFPISPAFDPTDLIEQ